MNKYAKITLNGLINSNPTFKLMLGMCATLALTTSAMNGLGMGLTVTVILILSNALVSLLRKVIPDSVRIPAFVVIIATLVTIVRMVLEKYIPALYDSMGLYLPLIVVNCIILGRAEAFASKNPVLASAVDGAATGLGFTFALTIMGIIREFFGSGSIFGLQIADIKIGFFSSAAGAFFVYGLCIAIFIAITSSVEQASLKKRGMTLRKDLLHQEVDS